jgi:hypothetical protein
MDPWPGPSDLLTSVFSPVQNESSAFAQPFEAVQKRRILSARCASASPPSATSSIRIHRTDSRGCFIASSPQVPVAFVKEIPQREAGVRRLLHVVSERSHAREDRRVISAMEQPGGHLARGQRASGIPVALQ